MIPSAALHEKIKNLPLSTIDRLSAISREELRQSFAYSGIGEESEFLAPDISLCSILAGLTRFISDSSDCPAPCGKALPADFLPEDDF